MSYSHQINIKLIFFENIVINFLHCLPNAGHLSADVVVHNVRTQPHLLETS